MSVESYADLIPASGEQAMAYGRRLEADGHEEMFIRKALAHHFGMEVHEFAEFCESYETARLRHITMIRLLGPNRSEYSMVKKIGKNLGVSDEQARVWYERFWASGDVPFIGMEALVKGT